MFNFIHVFRHKLPIFLVFLIFLPLYARMLFPKVRDADSISIASSLTDPQMATTYLIFIVSFVGVLFQLPKIMESYSKPYAIWIFIILLIALSLIPSDRVWYSAWRLFEVTSLVFMVFFIHSILLNARRYRHFAQFIPFFFYVFLVVFAIALILHPEELWTKEKHAARLGAISETIMMSPATLGPVSAMACGFSLLKFYRSKNKFESLLALMLFALSLTFCLMSMSRTGLIILVFNLGAVSYFSWRWNWTKVHPLVWCALLVPTMLIAMVFTGDLVPLIENFVSRGYGSESITNMSGRSGLWQFAWGEIMKHPLLGIGYATYPAFDLAGHMHNAWLELSLGVGLPASILLTIWLVKMFSFFKRLLSLGQSVLTHDQKYDLLLAFLMVSAAILNSLVSAGFAYFAWPLIVLFLGQLQLLMTARQVSRKLRRKRLRSAKARLITDTSGVNGERAFVSQ